MPFLKNEAPIGPESITVQYRCGCAEGIPAWSQRINQPKCPKHGDGVAEWVTVVDRRDYEHAPRRA